MEALADETVEILTWIMRNTSFEYFLRNLEDARLLLRRLWTNDSSYSSLGFNASFCNCFDARIKSRAPRLLLSRQRINNSPNSSMLCYANVLKFCDNLEVPRLLLRWQRTNDSPNSSLRLQCFVTQLFWCSLTKASFKDSFLPFAACSIDPFPEDPLSNRAPPFASFISNEGGSRYHPSGINYKRWAAQKKVRQENELPDHRKRQASGFFFAEMWSCDPYQEIVFMFFLFLADPRERASMRSGQRPSLRRKLEFNGAAVGILMNFSNVSRVEFYFHRSKHDGRQLIRIGRCEQFRSKQHLQVLNHKRFTEMPKE